MIVICQLNLKFLKHFLILILGVFCLIIPGKYITVFAGIKVLIFFILIIFNMLKIYFTSWNVLRKLIEHSAEIKLSVIHITTIYILIALYCLPLIILSIVEHIFVVCVFEYILFLDTIKFFAIIYQNKLTWNIQCKWTVNNLVSVILLIIINTIQLSLGENTSARYENLFFSISATTCLLNTIIGFILSRYRFSSG